MNPCETAVTATAIAIAIFNCVPIEELPAIVANLGQITATLGNMLRAAALEQVQPGNAANNAAENAAENVAEDAADIAEEDVIPEAGTIAIPSVITPL